MATIQEILTHANENIATIKEHAANNYLRTLMEVAYFPEKKMNLPEGTPPFKDRGVHPDQCGGAMWQIAKKIDVFLRTDSLPVRRESSFIQALESVSKMDAKILLATKDQTMDKLFPGLEYKELVKIGYFSEK